MTSDIEDTTVRIWTDGACIGNPGPGGWGYIKSFGGKTIPRSGNVQGATTNVAMELIAVIQALRSLTRLDLPVTVYTDLELVSRGMNEWLAGWITKGWRNAKREPVSHKELWLELMTLRDARQPGAEITFEWLQGHAGDPGNEAANLLANTAARMAEKLVGRTSLMPTRYDPERGLVVPMFALGASRARETTIG